MSRPCNPDGDSPNATTPRPGLCSSSLSPTRPSQSMTVSSTSWSALCVRAARSRKESSVPIAVTAFSRYRLLSTSFPSKVPGILFSSSEISLSSPRSRSSGPHSRATSKATRASQRGKNETSRSNSPRWPRDVRHTFNKSAFSLHARVNKGMAKVAQSALSPATQSNVLVSKEAPKKGAHEASSPRKSSSYFPRQ